MDKWVIERMVLQMDGRKKKANAGSNILQKKSGSFSSSEEKSHQEVACPVSADDCGQFVWADGCSSGWLHVPSLQCNTVWKRY